MTKQVNNDYKSTRASQQRQAWSKVDQQRSSQPGQQRPVLKKSIYDIKPGQQQPGLEENEPPRRMHPQIPPNHSPLGLELSESCDPNLCNL